MKIYSYSILYASSAEFQSRTPYVCAILEDDIGNRYACILNGYTDGMPVEIGMEVKQTGLQDGVPLYGL